MAGPRIDGDDIGITFCVKCHRYTEHLEEKYGEARKRINEEPDPEKNEQEIPYGEFPPFLEGVAERDSARANAIWGAAHASGGRDRRNRATGACRECDYKNPRIAMVLDPKSYGMLELEEKA